MQIYIIQENRILNCPGGACVFFVKQNLTYAGRRFVPYSGIISVGHLTLSPVYFRHSYTERRRHVA